MPFQSFDLDTHIDLPVLGKTYRIEAPDALTGLQVQKLTSLAQAAQAGVTLSDTQLESLKLDENGAEDFQTFLLGDAYQQLIDDKVPWPWMRLIISTTMVWITQGREAAEKIWQQAADPKEEAAPNRATRRASAKSTKPRGSTAGTTRRRAK